MSKYENCTIYVFAPARQTQFSPVLSISSRNSAFSRKNPSERNIRSYRHNTWKPALIRKPGPSASASQNTRTENDEKRCASFPGVQRFSIYDAPLRSLFYLLYFFRLTPENTHTGAIKKAPYGTGSNTKKTIEFPHGSCDNNRCSRLSECVHVF